MDHFIQLITQLFVEWGYLGLFVSAFVAGSILPFSSEVVMVILVKMGLDPAICVLSATLGNTLGGMSCYWIGHIGKPEWIRKYLKVDQAKLDKATRFMGGKGAWMAFFAFLPYIGEAIAIVLGLMRSNVWITTLSMFAGKLLRYVLMLAALKGLVDWVL